jgi:hypothetical protein
VRLGGGGRFHFLRGRKVSLIERPLEGFACGGVARRLLCYAFEKALERNSLARQLQGSQMGSRECRQD